MKRRLLSAFLAVMMVLTMAPVAFAADTETTTEYVAQVDGNKYETLADAIEAANNKTLTLLKDVNGQIVIPEGKTVTLDLNGNTVTAPSGRYDAVINQGTLTVTDSQKTGEIISNGNGGIGISAGSDTTIEYAKVTGREGAIGGDKSTVGAKLTINDGVFTGVDNAVVIFNGSKRDGDANKITINGGIFNGKIQSPGYIACGIYAPWKDDITVNNGTFNIENGAGIVARGGMVTVKGGEFNTTGDITGMVGDYKGTVPCSALVFDSTAGYPGMNDDSQIVVEDGKFKSDVAAVTVIKQTSDAGNRVKVSGGTFSSDVSAYVAEGYVQNNGTVEQLGETNAVAKVGNTYYKTLAEAVSAADNNTVTLLKNTVEDVVIPAGKIVTLDLNGKKLTVPSDCGIDVRGKDSTLTITGNGEITCNKTPICVSEGAVVIENGTINSDTDYCTYAKNGGTITVNGGTLTSTNAVLSGNNTTGNMNFIVNGGTLTARQGPAIYQSGQCELTITGGTLNGGISLRMGQVDISGGTINAATENLDSPAQYYDYSGNAWLPDALYVFGGTYNSTDSTYGNSLNLNITGGTFNCTNGQGSAIAIYDIGRVAQAAKITISGDAKLATTTSNRKAYDVLSLSDIGVTNPKTGYGIPELVGKVSTAVSGGYFTTDPSAYVASGYVAGTSDVSGYSYKVVAKTNTGSVEVKPAVAKPEVKVDKIPQADKEKVAAAAATVSAPTLGAAAADEAQKIDKSKADELVAKANKVTGDKKLYVQSALKVEPTAYDETTKTLALEITPQYRVVASTADTADKIKLDGDTKNAQVVQDYQTMNITKATVVTMELPTGFAVADGDKLSIQHTKNGTVEYYTGTVTKKDDKFYLTFTTNGFSPFVISVPEAAIESKVYPTLQAAVDSAKNDDIIDLYKDVAPDTKVTVAKTIKFKIATNSKKFDAAKNIVAGSNTTVKVTGESSPYIYEFTYTKPSSSSSGGSSSGKTTYKVTTSAVNNGGVNASPSTAEKGATITLTLSPDKGYKLDKLTVTDGSGKSVSTVKKSDTVYTFTMPASAVTVGVSYAKADETPSKTTFNDVSANDWFASAVDYVTGKGMMNGTAANTFSPKANTTRGMLMTVLARHAGEDTTGGSVWYEKGMNWAKANGVSDGTNPQVNITREQLAAMLYRYAQNKKYDVSGAKSLDGYTDAQSVSSYAVPALQWANAAGVVTGKSGSKLDPKGYATRAEVAAMLMRFCENVEK